MVGWILFCLVIGCFPLDGTKLYKGCPFDEYFLKVLNNSLPCCFVRPGKKGQNIFNIRFPKICFVVYNETTSHLYLHFELW